jgi:glyoxylase-like metal-dependent hydrolase (beta-lactamase superfamily II)
MNQINRRRFLTFFLSWATTLIVHGRNSFSDFIESSEDRETYHFKIGKFNCINFNTGYHDYPISSFFDGITADRIQSELKLSEPPESVKSPYACIYIDTGKQRILIDCGVGTYFHDEDQLQVLLKRERIPNESIDIVIITHAHPDHVGGILNDNGNLNFPNAKYYSSESEWKFYETDEAFNKAKEKYPDFALFQGSRTIYESIKNKLTYIEPETEIIPGIKVIDASGHTSGQLAVIVTSQDKKLIYISDVVFHPLHLEHPDWLPIHRYMFDQVTFKKNKKHILDMAADENMLVSAMHFHPPPSLGYINRNGNVWEWHPID